MLKAGWKREVEKEEELQADGNDDGDDSKVYKALVINVDEDEPYMAKFKERMSQRFQILAIEEYEDEYEGGDKELKHLIMWGSRYRPGLDND